MFTEALGSQSAPGRGRPMPACRKDPPSPPRHCATASSFRSKLFGLHEVRARGHRLELRGRETVDDIDYYVLQLTARRRIRGPLLPESGNLADRPGADAQGDACGHRPDSAVDRNHLQRLPASRRRPVLTQAGGAGTRVGHVALHGHDSRGSASTRRSLRRAFRLPDPRGRAILQKIQGLPFFFGRRVD